jgi:hypothetical protein
MSETLEWLTRGNVTEVKIVFASLVAALALYQVLLMAVGYRKVKLSFLSPESASRAHRTIGDTIVILTILVALMCISYFEIEDDNFAHSIFGIVLLLVLVLKVAVVRRWIRADGALPVLGITVCLLFIATWLSSAAGYLGR